MSTELVITQAQPLAVQPQGGLTIEQAYDAIVAGKLNSEQLQVMKQLLAMDSERKFTSAFVALQADLPVIVAKTVIPNRGKYERFEDVMQAIAPVLTRHGFSVAFAQGFTDNRIIETCTLMHIGGHSRSNSFAVRAGGRADSEIQADCKASTTAKRQALLNALNIVIRQDMLSNEDDAGMEGEFITAEQADAIWTRVKATKSNEEAFLKFAGSPLPMPIKEASATDLRQAYAKITTSRLAEIEKMLTTKESRK